MFAEKRQSIIYDKIQKFGAVTTKNLVQEFDVSVETIRRDLLAMEKQGLLKRSYGGAVENLSMKHFAELKERIKEFPEEKRILSINAASFVNEGDIISVDAGSTAIEFTQILKERFNRLTVVTHSLDVFNILCHHKNFEVILCAGHFLKEENAFYGTLVLDTLAKIHVQKAFVFPSAVSLEFGIGDYQKDLCMVQKQMISGADSVYILTDGSKFEKKALLKLDDMQKEYFYITDNKLSVGLLNLYKENGINIYTQGAK